MPLADALVSEAALHAAEGRYSLTLAFCQDCCLVQILETVPPEILYGVDYPYYSSFSPELLRHSAENAESLVASRTLGVDSLVIELASNDGYLLRNFQAAGIPVLGIDPAVGPVNAALAAGIPTMLEYFSEELAQRLKKSGISADVIIGNNVLAHVANLNGFVVGIATLLKADGVAVIEVPYVKDLIDHCEFDTIYHEHHCYFSVTALRHLLQRHGLTLSDVRHLDIHGGSLRLFITHSAKESITVKAYVEDESRYGMRSIGYYRDFGLRATRIRNDLSELVNELKNTGATIAAYAAAAKGATLLNFARITSELIDYVVDRNVHKQGRYMPGSLIPIRDPAVLAEEMPDYVLMLAWNFKDEILQQQRSYTDRGGRWIVPIPKPMVLDTQSLAKEA